MVAGQERTIEERLALASELTINKQLSNLTMFYLSYLLCIGDIVTRLFSILLALDRHHFDRVEQNSSLDTLYTKIFGGHDTKESKVCGQLPYYSFLITWHNSCCAVERE